VHGNFGRELVGVVREKNVELFRQAFGEGLQNEVKLHYS
jgi:hypothetical protein